MWAEGRSPLSSAHLDFSLQSEAVAEGALGVFAAIAACPGQFKPALVALLGRFRGEAGATMLQVGRPRSSPLSSSGWPVWLPAVAALFCHVSRSLVLLTRLRFGSAAASRHSAACCGGCACTSHF